MKKKNFMEVKNLYKTYDVGGKPFNALDGVNLSIDQGEFVVILGPSGAGKSTLLNLLGGMDTVTKGSILIDDKDISKLDSKGLTKYRANDVGFIFQFYNIMPTLTVLENVNLVKDVTETDMDADKVLKSVGLERNRDKFPNELSGGEQQRVSIARSISYNPSIIIADEPTGNLDPQTEKDIMEIFKKQAKAGKCVIIVTHSENVCKYADYIYELKKK